MSNSVSSSSSSDSSHAFFLKIISIEKDFSLLRNLDKINQSDLDKSVQFSKSLARIVRKLGESYSEKETTPRAPKITALEGSTDQLKKYAEFLLEQIEKFNRGASRLIRGAPSLASSSSSSTAPLQISEVLKLIKDLESSQARYNSLDELDALAHLPSIIERYLRVYHDNQVSLLDIERLNVLENMLRGLQLPGFQGFHQFIEQMCQDYNQSLRKDLQVIQEFKEQHFEEFKVLFKMPDLDAESHFKWFRLCSDLFWTVNNPFELHVGLKTLCAILLANLDQKNPQFQRGAIRIKHNDISLLKTIKVLIEAADSIQKAAMGETLIGQDASFRAAVIKYKNQFLSRVRQRNCNDRHLPRLNIAGGGPAGLLRAIVMGLKGGDVCLIEKRKDYERSNIVKLDSTPILEYLGVCDRLLQRNAIFENLRHLDVSLMHLEEVLDEIAKEIFGDNQYRVHGTVLDLKPVSHALGCTVEMADGTSRWLAADMFVDATGPKETLARFFEVDAIPMLKPQLMLTYIRKEKLEEPGNLTEGKMYDIAVVLRTPQVLYRLIQPKENIQRDLFKLLAQKEELENSDEIDQLIRQIQKEILSDQTGKKISKKKVELIKLVPVQIARRERLSLLFGNQLIMFVGDVVASPDPKSGAGAGNAIAGSALLGLIIDMYKHNRSPRLLQDFFNFGAGKHVSQVIQQGISKRKYDKAIQHIQTAAYVLDRAISHGWITQAEHVFLLRLRSREKFKISLLDQERASVKLIKERIDKIMIDKTEGISVLQEFNGLKRLLYKIEIFESSSHS